MAVVLIVDDSPTELHLFQKMLQKDGFDTLVADSGEEGLRKAKSSRPDCILMDVVMPEMDGWEVARELKANILTHPAKSCICRGKNLICRHQHSPMPSKKEQI